VPPGRGLFVGGLPTTENPRDWGRRSRGATERTAVCRRARAGLFGRGVGALDQLDGPDPGEGGAPGARGLGLDDLPRDLDQDVLPGALDRVALAVRVHQAGAGEHDATAVGVLLTQGGIAKDPETAVGMREAQLPRDGAVVRRALDARFIPTARIKRVAGLLLEGSRGFLVPHRQLLLGLLGRGALRAGRRRDRRGRAQARAVADGGAVAPAVATTGVAGVAALAAAGAQAVHQGRLAAGITAVAGAAGVAGVAGVAAAALV